MLLDNYFIQSGKALTEPLFLLTAAAIAFAVGVLWGGSHRRALLRSSIAAVILLALLGTDVVSNALLASLAVPSASGASPDVIVVAAGGAIFGESRETDALTGETALRVAAGVEAWRGHRAAKLVMAGTEPGAVPKRRVAELMRDAALCRGVPPSAIVMDPTSVNTREHALHLLTMPGVTPSTRVGLATSFWHMRRTVHVFRRFFTTVIPYPTHEVRRPYDATSFLPNASALLRSTHALHEWIGIAWYAFRDALDDSDSAVGSPARVQR